MSQIEAQTGYRAKICKIEPETGQTCPIIYKKNSIFVPINRTPHDNRKLC